MTKKIGDLEDMPEYKVGLWYSPYVKVYSIGGKNRIAEISSYPRSFKDITPHVYTEDTLFIITEGDLNHEGDGGRFYRDTKGDLYRIGEEATHWKGDSLPGAFPLWIEREDLPFTSDSDDHVFPIDKLPGPIRDLAEGEMKIGPTFMRMPESTLANMKKDLSTGKIKRKKEPQDSNKQIIRIRYRRRS